LSTIFDFKVNKLSVDAFRLMSDVWCT